MIEPLLAKRIRLVGFDVDGTMTDGGLYLGPPKGDGKKGQETKRFDIQDGLGMMLLRMSGVLMAIVTGRESDAARWRAEELQADDYASEGNAQKLEKFEEILKRRGVRWEEAAFVGDDIPDLPILKKVGLPVAVANAVPEVKQASLWTTTAPGGHGAVREFIEAFLKARGSWSDVVKTYLRERGDDGRI